MPAYSVEIDKPRCGEDRCHRSATHVVHDTRNARVGYRCGRHADELVDRLNAEG